MAEIDLLRRYPKAKRNLAERASAQSEEHIRIAREYGREYFDGPREFGYGGYYNDGRWTPVADDIARHFNWPLTVLDVGCAKGFLVEALYDRGADAFGFDISEYAVSQVAPRMLGRLHLGNCIKLPFPDNSFDAVVSINTVHNLNRSECIQAVREIQRVSGGFAYIQVDSYHTVEQRKKFLKWVLTAKTHLWPEEWKELFTEAGYTGDWGFTIIE